MIKFIALGIACVALRARPSTIIRLGEDGLLNTTRRIGDKARSAKNAVRREYRARMLDAASRQLERDMAMMRKLSPKQRDALAKDEAAIFARAEELREQREGGKPRHASRDGYAAQL